MGESCRERDRERDGERWRERALVNNQENDDISVSNVLEIRDGLHLDMHSSASALSVYTLLITVSN